MMQSSKEISDFCHLDADPIEGRILVASQDLQEGQLILSELPLVKYPQWNIPPTCLGCYAPIEGENYVFCKVCNWPMCSEKCCLTEDHRLECRLFEKNGVKVDIRPENEPISLYDVITPLRMLALYEKNRWPELTNLMSHIDDWEKESSWMEQHQPSVDFILENFTVEGIHIDERLILELFGIAYINDFSSLVGEVRLRLAFPNAAMFSHDCTPNVVRHIEPSKHGHKILCYAARAIPKGQRLTTTYVDLFLPGLIRRDILRKSKHFECRCDKCRDPTELGSHGGSIRCIKCKKGYMMSPQWTCDSCQGQISPENGEAVIFRAYRDSNDLHSTKTKRSVEKYEQYLQLYGNILHPNNLCLVRIKYTLIGFYGRISGYRVPEMVAQPGLLDRKLQLAKQVLSVLELTEPGLSSSKGVILYEMHMPIFLKAQLSFNLGRIDSGQAKHQFERSVKCIQEAINLLKYNSHDSFGHQLYKGAQATEKQLKSLIKKF